MPLSKLEGIDNREWKGELTSADSENSTLQRLPNLKTATADFSEELVMAVDKLLHPIQ